MQSPNATGRQLAPSHAPATSITDRSTELSRYRLQDSERGLNQEGGVSEEDRASGGTGISARQLKKSRLRSCGRGYLCEPSNRRHARARLPFVAARQRPGADRWGKNRLLPWRRPILDRTADAVRMTRALPMFGRMVAGPGTAIVTPRLPGRFRLGAVSRVISNLRAGGADRGPGHLQRLDAHKGKQQYVWRLEESTRHGSFSQTQRPLLGLATKLRLWYGLAAVSNPLSVHRAPRRRQTGQQAGGLPSCLRQQMRCLHHRGELHFDPLAGGLGFHLRRQHHVAIHDLACHPEGLAHLIG